MALGKLTREQNVRGAKVFLNNFDLKLEEKEGLTKNSRLRILNSLDEQVGELYFDGDFIMIETDTPFGKMTANYTKSYYNVGFDVMNGFLKYCDWSSDISFDILKSENENIRGVFSVYGAINEELEKSVDVQTQLIYTVDGKEKVVLSFVTYDKLVAAFINDENYEEITYSRSRVSDQKSISDSRNDFLVTEEDGRIVAKNTVGDMVYYFETERASTDPDDKLVQMIRKMNRINPRIGRRMKGLRNIFSAGDVDLVNNFLGASIPADQHDNAYRLFEIEKKPVVYQDGSETLHDAYYGKDDSFNLRPKMHKKMKNQF